MRIPLAGAVNPPGWVITSTLDLEAPEADEFETLYPKTVKVEPGRDQQVDLELSVLR